MQDFRKYHHYALDKTGQIIDIKKAQSQNGESYYCPHCHNEMIKKCGEIKQWHFAHKTEKCSYDHYLHTLAEDLLMKWFNQTPHIWIKLKGRVACRQIENCLWEKEENKCYQYYDLEKFDLKTIFKVCEKEVRFTKEGNTYVADLYSENTYNGQYPLFIEIDVTNECETKKKESGIKIIELHIENEEDIQKIINHPIEENENITFYNFHTEEKRNDEFRKPLKKYQITNEGECVLESNSYTCKNYKQTHNGSLEITCTRNQNIQPTIVAKMMEWGFIEKDCGLCKLHVTSERPDNSQCTLKQIMKEERQNAAKECNLWRKDEALQKQLAEQFNLYEKEHLLEVWRKKISHYKK